MCKHKEKCPICGAEIMVNYDTLDYGIVCEEWYRCHTCDYRYEFAYGNYRMRINNREFRYWYNSSLSEMDLIHRRAKNEAYKVQKRLRRLGKLRGRVRICL